MLSSNFRCTDGQQRVRNANIVGEFGLGLRDRGFRVEWVDRGEIAIGEYLSAQIALIRCYFQE